MHFAEDNAGVKMPIRCYYKICKAPHYIDVPG